MVSLLRGDNEMKSEEAKRNFAAYQAKWDKENTVRVALKLNRRTDADIIEFLNLNAQDNKAGAIKAAIRAYMKGEQK